MFSHEHLAEASTNWQLSGERAQEQAIRHDKPLLFGVESNCTREEGANGNKCYDTLKALFCRNSYRFLYREFYYCRLLFDCRLKKRQNVEPAAAFKYLQLSQ